MSKEGRINEPYRGGKPYEIQFGIPFKPFVNARRFYHTPKGLEPFYISEDYDYGIALRKRVSLYGIEGFVDVITDDPISGLQSLFGENCRLVEKPMGETHFESIYKGKDNQEFTEEPCILRFSFLVHNPGEYAKLLNTEADIELGKERYLLIWNQNRPLVKRCMQYLEEKNKKIVVVTEKNLFNHNELNFNEQKSDYPDGELEIEELEKLEFGRITFIWLPAELKQLRKIKLTFYRLDDGGGSTEPLKPIDPEKERIPILYGMR